MPFVVSANTPQKTFVYLRDNRQVSKITLWISVEESDWYIVSIEGRLNFQNPTSNSQWQSRMQLYALTIKINKTMSYKIKLNAETADLPLCTMVGA